MLDLPSAIIFRDSLLLQMIMQLEILLIFNSSQLKITQEMLVIVSIVGDAIICSQKSLLNPEIIGVASGLVQLIHGSQISVEVIWRLLVEVLLYVLEL